MFKVEWSHLERWLDPWKRRIVGMIAKAVVEEVTDKGGLQVLKVSSSGQAFSDVTRLQNYGFTSVPPKGAQALLLSIAGNRDNPIIIAVDDGETRFKIDTDGAVAVYDNKGGVITIKNGIIEMGDGNPLLPTDGVVTGGCNCAFTGDPHPVFSQKVRAKR